MGPVGELEIVFRPDPTVYDGRFEPVVPIHTHELLTVCPTGEIAIGDLNDAGSTVSWMRDGQVLNEALLADLGTRPRTTPFCGTQMGGPTDMPTDSGRVQPKDVKQSGP